MPFHTGDMNTAFLLYGDVCVSKTCETSGFGYNGAHGLYLEVNALCEPFATFRNIWADLLRVSAPAISERKSMVTTHVRGLAGMGSSMGLKVILLRKRLGAAGDITQERLVFLLRAAMLCPDLSNS